MAPANFMIPKSKVESQMKRFRLQRNSSSRDIHLLARSWDHDVVEQVEDGENGTKRTPTRSKAVMEAQELRSLNESLDSLTSIFPDVQPEVFRELLSNLDGESRLQVVVESLIKHKARWVRGRWRLPAERTPEGSPSHGKRLAKADHFRCERYRTAVRNTLAQEFRGLSRSTLDAVLAEHNYCYTLVRPALVDLSSKSWRFSLSSFFLRRRGAPSTMPADHPQIRWQPGGDGMMVPTLKATGFLELDLELQEALIQPLQQSLREQQTWEDHQLAVQMNEAEAEHQDTSCECECCFSSVSFEQVSACDQSGHLVCFRCLRHAVSEAIYGQGWMKNTSDERATIRCIAPNLGGGDECRGCVPLELVRRALADERGGEQIIKKLDERFITEDLQKAGLALIRCPFCSYAEADDLIHRRRWRFSRAQTLSAWTPILCLLGLGLLIVLLLFFLISSMVSYIGQHPASSSATLRGHFTSSLTRIARRQRGLRFTCRAPDCSRSSCVSCDKEWHDIHICYESERVALRAHVERAMSLVVKRTCPRCDLSFVKASGCNKLTCICGYNMCYVCRREIGREGYRHFCEHFRPKGSGACDICEKCDLYRSEDEEEMVRQAGERAEKEWKEERGGLQRWGSKLKDGSVEAFGAKNAWWYHSALYRTALRWPEGMDFFLEHIFEFS